LFVAGVASVEASAANPLGTVLSLLDELTAKVKNDGEVEAKAYAEYVEWCDETSQNVAYAIDTASKEKEKLEAHIGQLSSDIETAGSKIDDLAGAIATAEGEVTAATQIRDKEAADFAASEKALVTSIDQLSRAIGILEKEMAKNPAAFAQVDMQNMASALAAWSTVLDAAAFSTNDRKQLAALVQTQQESADDDEDVGAPAAATYKTHSTNILDVLEDLKEKAEGELSDLRKAEVNTRHNFDMLKQSLEDQLANDNKHMKDEKAGRAAAEEAKATDEGDLDVTNKELADSKEQQATTRSTCVQVAADHDTTVAARTEELKVIAQARQILADTSSGAVGQTYSLVQTGITSRADLVGREVVETVRRLAKQEHSAALAQLASRIAAVARYGGSNSADVFGKIKGLIRDMIAKLERQAGDEATEKAYCDEQIAKTEQKKSELEEDIEKATSRIDQAAAESVQLKAQIKDLEMELAQLAKDQASMDKIRMETHADYEQAKADLELGLTGVRKALVTLRDYYGGAAAMLQSDSGSFMQQPAKPELHEKSSGAGGSIIDILEVVESDFATNLAKEEETEADAQSEYEKVSQENAVTKTTKDQSIKYKTQEFKARDATVAEYSGDRETAQTELSAVLDFYAKIKERCIAKPEGYEERKRRRDAEINGLKEALTILEDETAALVQRKHRGSFRGAMHA